MRRTSGIATTQARWRKPKFAPCWSPVLIHRIMVLAKRRPAENAGLLQGRSSAFARGLARMFRRLQFTTVLLAWLLATGSQWDCAQVFAWGKMVANYSRTMPTLDAVRLTFAPGNECDLCVSVGDAKQRQNNPATPAAKMPGKILLVFQPAPAVIVTAPEIFSWSPSDPLMALGASRASPPVPPPRAA